MPFDDCRECRRMKPDLLAPGNYVLSAGARPGEVGECDPEDGSLPRLGLKKEGLNYMAGGYQISIFIGSRIVTHVLFDRNVDVVACCSR